MSGDTNEHIRIGCCASSDNVSISAPHIAAIICVSIVVICLGFYKIHVARCDSTKDCSLRGAIASVEWFRIVSSTRNKIRVVCYFCRYAGTYICKAIALSLSRK
ncbi:hypothetical protein BDV32DRAFT_119775 [Aspergillus pseudonomiae]|nr:hypothetical protein BDV32DRAFT_119775 [Aspergillus pseudonomiae]